MRLTVTLVLVLAAAFATAAGVLAAPSPSAELAAMQSAVGTEHSVRYISNITAPGYKARTISDVGPGKGIQRTTVTVGGKTGPAVVRVVPKKGAYIKGTEFTMRAFFGFSPLQAAGYAGRWIFVPRATPAFKTLAKDATFGSVVADLFPTKNVSLVKTATQIGVRGTIPHVAGTKTVLAPKQGKQLPAKATTSFSNRPDKDVWTLSRWNEAVRVPVPAKWVPISVVAGGG